MKTLGSGRVQMDMLVNFQELRLKELSCMMCCTCLNAFATCFLYELQLLRATLTIAISGMRMERIVERDH